VSIDWQLGSFIDRYGPRIVSVTSFASLVPIFIMFPLVSDESLRSRVLFVSLLIAAGFSFSAIMLPVMVEISEPIERKEKESPGIFGAKGANAQAYALHAMAWASGQLLGPIVAGALVQTVGWRSMNVVLAVVSGLTSLMLACTSEKIRVMVGRKAPESPRS
jgi:MFS family permease